MKIAAFALALAAMTASVSARDLTIDIGKWEADRESGVRLSVVKSANATNVVLFVHDRRVINSVYMRTSIAEVKELRALLDEAIKDAELQAGQK